MNSPTPGQEYEDQLLGMIDQFLGGQIGFNEFADKYYDYYIEIVPDEALSDKAREFFGSVQERLDWTAEAPPSEDRLDGWTDQKEFFDFVGRARSRYREDNYK